jgi:lysophospholipase L1-like esterase
MTPAAPSAAEPIVQRGIRTRILRKLRSASRSLLIVFLVTLGLLLVLESALRIGFDYPRGYFRFMVDGSVTLYPPRATLPMRWGAIPYDVRTNALGFRGEEIDLVAPPGRQRILALGDSVTDGFFVDDDATFPAQLQRILRERGRNVEVINAARGGGSIDKEYAILREHGFPLRPDVVVLTFVTNDIFDIRERSLDDLLTRDLHPREQTAARRILTETAIGEWATDVALRLRFRSYRASDRPSPADVPRSADGRYDLWGTDRVEENIQSFRQLTKGMDGMVLDTPFSVEVDGIIENYLAILERMSRDCEERKAKLLFVYFPAYSQVYDPGASLAIRDLLERACAARSIPFVDLTEPFRTKAKGRVLFLAPLDYHPNPAGLGVMAHVIGDRLLSRSGG